MGRPLTILLQLQGEARIGLADDVLDGADGFRARLCDELCALALEGLNLAEVLRVGALDLAQEILLLVGGGLCGALQGAEELAAGAAAGPGLAGAHAPC